MDQETVRIYDAWMGEKLKGNTRQPWLTVATLRSTAALLHGILAPVHCEMVYLSPIVRRTRPGADQITNLLTYLLTHLPTYSLTLLAAPDQELIGGFKPTQTVAETLQISDSRGSYLASISRVSYLARLERVSVWSCYWDPIDQFQGSGDSLGYFPCAMGAL